MQNNEVNNESKLFGIPDAARFLALSERRLRQMIKDQEISSVRIGKRISISLAQLEAFVEAHQQ